MSQSIAPHRAATIPENPVHLWDPRIRPYTLAVAVLVTIGAYLNRSTLTLMPGIAQELDGRSLFGAASSAALAAYAVGAAGVAAFGRNIGQRTLITVGVGSTILSATSMMLATTMVHVVLVRVCVGASEAIVDIGLTAWVARYVPAAVRPKMFALFATLWMLPSLIGPAVADVLATHSGWRLAYAIPPVLMALALPIIWRVIPTLDELSADDDTEHQSATTLVVNGLLLVVSIAAMAWAATAVDTNRTLAVATTFGAVVLVCWSVVKMLPQGAAILRPGVAGLIGWRAIISAMFASLAAFIPFLLTDLYALRPAIAAVSLSITGVAWAFGSNLAASRRAMALSPATRLASGAACLVVGAVGVGLVLIGVEWVLPGMVLWTCSGVGMGIATNTSSALVAEWSSGQTVTQNSAATAQAVSAGTAGATAALGVMLAATDAGQTRWLFAGICVLVVVVNCGLTFAAKRVTRHSPA